MSTNTNDISLNGDKISNDTGATTSSDHPLFTDTKDRKRQQERPVCTVVINKRTNYFKNCCEARQQKKVIVNLIDVEYYGQIRSGQ